MSIVNIKQEHLKTTACSGYDIDKINKRVIVNGYSARVAVSELCADLVATAKNHNLEKIWVWGFYHVLPDFIKHGFMLEGVLADDILRKPAFSLAKYLNPRRGNSERIEMENEVLATISANAVKPAAPLPGEITLRLLAQTDSAAVAGLLKNVFPTYPTPVQDPFYIKELMRKNCLFAGAFHGKTLVSVAAAYLDPVWFRCEMTDCATLPAYRGRYLTERLLKILEPEVRKRGNYTLYTLARAVSGAMNRTFYRLNYRYKGRLINNCHIAGRFEDMNLWVKY